MLVEVACIRLESPRDRKLCLHNAPYDKRNAALRFALTDGIRILSRMSKHVFHLLQDTQDSTMVYYIGQWRSLACYADFRASENRREFLAALQDFNASLAWQELYDTDFRYPRKFASRLLRGFSDLFAAPLVGIMRFRFDQDLRHGRLRMDVDEVLSHNNIYTDHRYLVSSKPRMWLNRDVLLSGVSMHPDEPQQTACLAIGEWRPKDRGSGNSMGSGLESNRLIPAYSEIDMRIASPIHLI